MSDIKAISLAYLTAFLLFLRCCVTLDFDCKLFCQNLSLFGKLFIDIKTLFFDCENCGCFSGFSFIRSVRVVTPDVLDRIVLFYLLTDADSQRDHVLGFFSKVIELLLCCE